MACLWKVHDGAQKKSIVDAVPNELFAEMPVIYITAITVDKKDSKNMYECPLYKGTMRGPTFVGSWPAFVCCYKISSVISLNATIYDHYLLAKRNKNLKKNQLNWFFLFFSLKKIFLEMDIYNLCLLIQ